MTTKAALTKKIKAHASGTHLDLSSQKLSDSDIIYLCDFLKKNQKITSVNLTDNNITDTGSATLAKNATLKTLKLKKGNQISVSGLELFLKNKTLTTFPVYGSGDRISKIRNHIIKNKTRKPKAPLKLKKKPVKLKLNIIKPPPLQAITKSTEDGEKDFLELASFLLLDLKHNPSNHHNLLPYVVVALNLFMHNSTHAPMQGFGKAQKREREGKGLYYRSQYLHPHATFFSATLRKSNAGYKGQRSYMPPNRPLQALLQAADISNTFKTNINRLDKQGFKKGKKSAKYLGTLVAYAGLRTNNFQSYLTALKQRSKGNINNAMQEVLTSFVAKRLPNKLKKIDDKTIEETTKEAIKRLKSYGDSLKYHQNLQTETFITRNRNADFICLKTKKLQLITTQHVPGTTCITIELYPDFKDLQRSTDNYKEGLTNVIIGFLGGLLNYNAQRLGLSIHTERRQSFGFLRPTLTDVGALRIRLSLGLEPKDFNQVVITSLEQLNTLLKTFNFVKKKKVGLVKKCFNVSEKPKGANITKKTGTFLLTSMRSDEDKWAALHAAKKQLVTASNKQSKDPIKTAFEHYLKNFVIKRTQEVAGSTRKRNTQLITEAVTLTQTSPAKRNLGRNKTLNILKVLENTVKLSSETTKNIKLPKNNQLKRCYYQTLTKLATYCNNATNLLKNKRSLEVSHLYAEANLLIENMLEYLTSLHGLLDLQNKQDNAIISQYMNSHKKRVRQKLNINEDQCINIFSTDSGQQAVIASILAMDSQLYNDGKALSAETVFIANESYFEIKLFFDKIGIENCNKSSAKIIFTDVTLLQGFQLNHFPLAETIIIDLTHNTCLNNKELNAVIKNCLQTNKRVVLVESLLKHGQLGLDKYQSGRITVINPSDDSLSLNIMDELETISEAAMHPYIARYLHTVDTIYQENDAPLVSRAKGYRLFEATENKPTGTTFNATPRAH